MKSKLIDITHPIHEGMTTFPVHWHPFVEITQLGRFGIEDRESRKLTFGTHTGTHFDAPRHFVPNGMTIDQVPVETMVGPAKIVDFSDVSPLTEIKIEDFKEQLGEDPPERLVMCFDWSRHWGSITFYDQHPFISEETAVWFKDKGVKLLGMDTPQADNPKHGKGNDPDSPIHKILLEANIVQVECLTKLRLIDSRDFELIALPLPIRDGDGSPARCIARVPISGNLA